MGLLSMEKSVTRSKFLILSKLPSMKLFERLILLMEIRPLVSLMVAILLLLRSMSSKEARFHKPSSTAIKFPLKFRLFRLMHFSSLSIFLTLLFAKSKDSRTWRRPSP